MHLSACAFIATACFMLLQACGSGDDDASGGAGSGGAGSGGSAGQGTGGASGSGSGASGAGGGASTCDSGCAASIAAHCPNGPTDQTGCVRDCKALSAGTCAAPYAAFQTCADGEPITCNSDGIPAVEACADEQAAFIACLN